MNNLRLKFGQNCSYTRSQRRAYERKLKKELNNIKILVPNNAFKKVRPELLKHGWYIQEDCNYIIEIRNKWSHILTTALKLYNEIFDMTIITHEDGIEISRVVVKGEYQSQGLGSKFLDNLLVFLTENGIKEIYVYPGIVDFGKYNQSHSTDPDRLESFYLKIGFREQVRDPYWKLNVNSFLSYCTIKSVDQFLLSGITQKNKNS